MLLNKNIVTKLLRCPKSGAPLKHHQGKLSSNTTEYGIKNGYPILIDYEKSILKEKDISDLSSVIQRSSNSGPKGFIKRLLFPPLKVTARNVEQILNHSFKSNDKIRVLIVGGGTIGQSMSVFYEDSKIELISFDIYASPFVQFIADAHNIPLPDEHFDVVIIQAVLEHVLEPNKVVSEIHRLLNEDGIIYAETPFLQHVHEGAYDFTRYTESGHRYLFRNFSIIDSGCSMGAGTQLLWSLDNFFRGLFRSRTLGKVVRILFFWLQYLDIIIPEKYNIDAASGVFFLGEKQNFRVKAIDMVGYYKGAQK